MQPFDTFSAQLRAARRVITLPQRVAAEWFRLGVDLVGGVPAAMLPLLQPILMTKPNVATKHPFLSDEWIEAARAIRDEYRGRTSPPPIVKINLNVTAVPFRDYRDLEAHVDTTGGDADIDLAHIDAPDITVTIDYETAKALLVTMDVNAAMGAFMRGDIKVEGDIAKLMALQAAQVEPLALEAAGRIQALTE